MDNQNTEPGANPEGGEGHSPDNSQTEVIAALTETLSRVEGQVNQLRSGKDVSVAKTNKRLSGMPLGGQGRWRESLGPLGEVY